MLRDFFPSTTMTVAFGSIIWIEQRYHRIDGKGHHSNHPFNHIKRNLYFENNRIQHPLNNVHIGQPLLIMHRKYLLTQQIE